MNFTEYRPLALRTAKMFPTQRENLRHAALGLITEIGEFTTEVKRHVIYGKPITEEMTAHMREELGDAYWYLPLGFMAIGADPAELTTYQLDEIAELDDLGDLTLTLSVIAMGVSACIVTDSIEDERIEMIDFLTAIVACLDQACTLLGFNSDEVRAENIAKLRARFPDKYTDEAAEARADKGGLDARIS